MVKVTNMRDVVHEDELCEVTITVHSNRSGNDYVACKFLIAMIQLEDMDYSASKLLDYIEEVVDPYQQKFQDKDASITVSVEGLLLFRGDENIPGAELKLRSEPGILSLKDSVDMALEMAYAWAIEEHPPF